MINLYFKGILTCKYKELTSKTRILLHKTLYCYVFLAFLLYFCIRLVAFYVKKYMFFYI